MTLSEQAFAQALLLAGGLDPKQETLLKLLCRGATSSLTARLREGVSPEDCKADFVAAASLFAVAAMSEAGQLQDEADTDVTQRSSSSNAAANCLRYQAELIITPYLKDSFTFREI